MMEILVINVNKPCYVNLTFDDECFNRASFILPNMHTTRLLESRKQQESLVFCEHFSIPLKVIPSLHVGVQNWNIVDFFE